MESRIKQHLKKAGTTKKNYIMSEQCSIHSNSLNASQQLSKKLQQLLSVENEGVTFDRDVAITPEIADKIINDAIGYGLIDTSDLSSISSLSLLKTALDTIKKGCEKKGTDITKYPAARRILNAYYAYYEAENENNEIGTQVQKTLDETVDNEAVGKLKTDAAYASDDVREGRRDSSLIDVFNGDSVRMNAFCKAFGGMVIYMLQNNVINDVIKESQEKIDKLKKNIKLKVNAKGVAASDDEIASMRTEMMELTSLVENIKEEGWLYASSSKDIMTRALNIVWNDLQNAALIEKRAKQLRNAEDKRSSVVILQTLAAEYNLKFSSNESWVKILKASLNKPFLETLFQGVFESTSDEEINTVAKNTSSEDNERLLQLLKNKEDNKEEVEKKDLEIQEKRALSEKYQAEMFDRICLYLGEVTGVSFSVDKANKKPDDMAEESDDKVDEEFANDIEKENSAEDNEDGKSDVFFTKDFDQDLTSTLSAEVKRMLSSLEQVTYMEDGSFKVVTDTEFGMPVYLSRSYAFAYLLDMQSRARNGKGFRDSDEMYQHLRERERETPWIHSIIKRLDKDLSMRTKLFVAINKFEMPVRSVSTINRGRNKNERFVSPTGLYTYGENTDSESAKNISASILARQSSGILLQEGLVGKYSFNQDFRRFLETFQTYLDSENKKDVKAASNGNLHYIVEFHDISIYNENGERNAGRLRINGIDKNVEYDKYDDAAINKLNVTVSFGGALGFTRFVDMALFELPDSYNDALAKDPYIGHKMVTILKSIGFECDESQLASAFSNDKKAFKQSKELIKTISVNIHGSNEGLVYDTIKKEILHLAKYLPLAAGNTLEQSFRFGGKSRSPYQNKNYITELTAELGDDESDEDVTEYIENNFIGHDHGDSLFMENVNGEGVFLNGILADLMPTNNIDSKNNEVSKLFRRAFSLGTNSVIGKKNEKDEVTDTSDFTISDLFNIEFTEFLQPKTKFSSYLGHAITERKGEAPINFVAKYSYGTFADYGNMIFVGARRHPAGVTLTPEGRLKVSYLLSYEKDGLLHRMAKMTFAEANRINVFLRNKYNKKSDDSSSLPKTFKKNADKFCNFPGMNYVIVKIGEELMPFIDAINKLRAEDVYNETVYFKRSGEDEYREVPRSEPSMSSAEMLAMDVARLEMTDMAMNSIAYLREKGAFNKVGESNPVASVAVDLINNLIEANDKDMLMILDRERREVEENGNVSCFDVLRKMSEKMYFAELYLLEENEREATISQYIDAIERFKYHLENLSEASKNREPIKKLTEYISSFDTNREESRTEKSKIRRDAPATESELVLPIGSKPIGRELFCNKQAEQLIEFEFNKIAFLTQINPILVGDIAQFSGIGEYSKRLRGCVAASERCDLSAIDTRHGDRKCIEYYGERKINSKYKNWDIRYQRTITINDLETRNEKVGEVDVVDENGNVRKMDAVRNTGFANMSQFFNDDLAPRLEADLKAGLISPQEYADTCSAYGSMCTTDGQSFRTLESMKKMLDMLGLNNDAIDELYTAVVIDKRKLRYDEIRGAMRQLKSVAYDFQDKVIEYTEKDPVTKEKVKMSYHMRMVDFIKDSEFTLLLYSDEYSKYMGDNSMLQGVLDFASENMVDVIHFMSTKKTGETNVVDLSECRNGSEAFNKLTSAVKVGQIYKSKSIFHKESWERVGRQIPSTDHLTDKKQALGTQVEKLIAVDMNMKEWSHVKRDEQGNVITDDRGKPIVENSEVMVTVRDSEGNVEARLTPQEYKARIDAIKIINMYEDLQKLEKLFGDKKKLSEKLISAARANGKYPDTIINGLRINDETGDFNIPLDNPIMTPVVESVLSSLVRNHVIKQKTTGGTAVQFSSVGRTEALKVVTGIDEVSHQPYMKYVEAMLPAWSKKLFEAYADENGEIDINKIPNDLKSMVGYRVPTEHVYSIVPIRIVGFLPTECGTSIMLPQEIVTWSGSDFDIDKIFLEIPTFDLVKKSKYDYYDSFLKSTNGLYDLVFEEWRSHIEQDLSDPSISEDDKSKLQIILDNPKGNEDAFYEYRKSWAERNGEEGQRGNLMDVATPEMMAKVEAEFDKYAKEQDEKNGTKVNVYNSLRPDCMLDEIRSASRQERDNLLVRLHFSRLTSDFSFMNLTRPGGFTTQKKMERVITILKNSEEGEFSVQELMNMSLDELNNLASKYRPLLRINDVHANYDTFDRNCVGGKMIGIYALHNAFHAAIQWSKKSLSKGFIDQFGFEINGNPMRTVLGDIYDEDGNSITLNIAGFLAASVDNAKDPVLAGLAQNSMTADLTLSLLHVGYSIPTAILIMTQPIVQLMLDKSGASNSFGVTLFLKEMSFDKTKGFIKSSPVNLTSLGDNVGKRFSTYNEACVDPFQSNILYILRTMCFVSECISTSLNALKVTSPHNNLGNNLGVTMKRMSPIDELSDVNVIEIDKDQNDKTTITIFDKSFSELIKSSNDNSLANSDNENALIERLSDVNSYLQQGQNEGKVQVPLAQASYDFGFASPILNFTKIMGSYGNNMKRAILTLNGLDGFGSKKIMLSEDIIRDFVNDYKLYCSMRVLLSDKSDFNNVPEMRRAYLNSFPKYYFDVLQKMHKNGRDLINEFAILRNLAYDGNDTKMLRFVNDGRTNIEIKNEYVNSWDRMANDSAPEVRNLAYQMFKYSIIYNGGTGRGKGFGQYAPSSVMEKFGKYNEVMRNIGKEEIPMHFIDQFIRNHVDDLRVARVVNPGHEFDPIKLGLAHKTVTYDVGRFNQDGDIEVKKRTILEPNDYIVVNDDNSFLFSGRKYLKVKINGEYFIYRLEEIDGKLGDYVRVSRLGDGAIREYNPYEDSNIETTVVDNFEAIDLYEQIRITVEEKKNTVLSEIAKKLEEQKSIDESLQDGKMNGGAESGIQNQDVRAEDYINNNGNGLIKHDENYESWKDILTFVDELVSNESSYAAEEYFSESDDKRSEVSSMHPKDVYGVRQEILSIIDDMSDVLQISDEDEVKLNVPVSASVDTKNGSTHISDTISVLVKHSDGTFSVGMIIPASNNYIKTNMITVAKVKKYMNMRANVACAILKNRYPNMEIKSMSAAIVKVNTEVIDANYELIKDKSIPTGDGEYLNVTVDRKVGKDAIAVVEDQSLTGIKLPPVINDDNKTFNPGSGETNIDDTNLSLYSERIVEDRNLFSWPSVFYYMCAAKAKFALSKSKNEEQSKQIVDIINKLMSLPATRVASSLVETIKLSDEDLKEWNDKKKTWLKAAIKKSFSYQAVIFNELMATDDTMLTSNDTSEFGALYTNLLMEVRNEMHNNKNTSYQQTPFYVHLSSFFSNIISSIESGAEDKKAFLAALEKAPVNPKTKGHFSNLALRQIKASQAIINELSDMIKSEVFGVETDSLAKTLLQASVIFGLYKSPRNEAQLVENTKNIIMDFTQSKDSLIDMIRRCAFLSNINDINIGDLKDDFTYEVESKDGNGTQLVKSAIGVLETIRTLGLQIIDTAVARVKSNEGIFENYNPTVNLSNDEIDEYAKRMIGALNDYSVLENTRGMQMLNTWSNYLSESDIFDELTKNKEVKGDDGVAACRI